MDNKCQNIHTDLSRQVIEDQEDGRYGGKLAVTQGLDTGVVVFLETPESLKLMELTWDETMNFLSQALNCHLECWVLFPLSALRSGRVPLP